LAGSACPAGLGRSRAGAEAGAGSPLTAARERLRDTIKRPPRRRGPPAERIGQPRLLYDDNVIQCDRAPELGMSRSCRARARRKEDSHGETANARLRYTWLRGPLFGWVPREATSFRSRRSVYSFFGTYYNDLDVVQHHRPPW